MVKIYASLYRMFAHLGTGCKNAIDVLYYLVGLLLVLYVLFLLCQKLCVDLHSLFSHMNHCNLTSE